MSSEAHCCVTAKLVHASASPTYSTAHTTYKSVLQVSLTHASLERWDDHLPRRYWKNPVTRFRDVVFLTATSLNWAIVMCCTLAVFLSVTLSVCLWRCHPNRKCEKEEKDQLSFFSFRKQNRAGCTAFPGERLTLPLSLLLFLFCPPLNTHTHVHTSRLRERPLMEGCFYEAGVFVLSVVQRSHATVDVPNQPPLLHSASNTIPSTSSTIPVLIQSARRELWDHRVAGTLVYAGAGLAPVLYSLPTDSHQNK